MSVHSLTFTLEQLAVKDIDECDIHSANSLSHILTSNSPSSLLHNNVVVPSPALELNLRSCVPISSRIRSSGPYNSSRHVDNALDDLTSTHHAPLETSYYIRVMTHFYIPSACTTQIEDTDDAELTSQFRNRRFTDAFFKVYLTVYVPCVLRSFHLCVRHTG